MDNKLAKIILLNIIITAAVAFAVVVAMKHLAPSTESSEDPKKLTVESEAKVEGRSITGVYKVAGVAQGTEIKFSSGYIRVDYNGSGNEVNWDCDGEGSGLNAHFEAQTGTAILNFSGPYLDCDVTIPNKPLRIRGGSGKIEVRQIQAALDVDLQKGTVYLDAIPGKAYSYKINAENTESEDAPPGDVDKLDANAPFVSSNQADALSVKVVVKSGAVLPLSEAEDTE